MTDAARSAERLFDHPGRLPSMLIGASVLVRIDFADPTSGRVDGHVHTSWFVGKDADHRANCGDLTFRASEFWPLWQLLRHDFEFAGLERVPPAPGGWLHSIRDRYYDQCGPNGYPELAAPATDAAEAYGR